MSKYKIALAGNPNVGKSTIFNILTGLNQHTGNWAGKTVENASGKYVYHGNEYEIYDLPGTYSLNVHSKEEVIAKEFIESGIADVTVVVCNAVSLEKSLFLVEQIMQLTSNIIVVVNLMDEAKKKGITIDLKKLEKLLGIPIVSSSAVNNEGIESLLVKIEEASSKKSSKKGLKGREKSFSDVYKESCYLIKRCHFISKKVVQVEDEDYLKKERKFDKILTSKATGIPLMLLMLFVIFWLTIVGSNYPSEWLFDFLARLEEPLYNFLSFLPTTLDDLLVFGVYKTCYWVVSVMLPPMLIFFPLFTILEDIGILPRIAFNMDPAFSRCNSCGKQALTMCMGIGCNAVGVTGCRIIDSKRERILAIITNSFMPCNGRYPTMIAIISMFFIGASRGLMSSLICALILVFFLGLSIFITFVINNFLSKTILKGEGASFILELPDYRRIKVGKIIIKSIRDRTFYVLGRAVLIAAPTGALIYLIVNFSVGGVSILTLFSEFLSPLGIIMGLDGVILLSFLLGFPANEIVMPIMLMTYLGNSTLTSYDSLSSLKDILLTNGWTIKTAICFLIFTLFHFPCCATVLTIKKETNSLIWTFLSVFIPLLIGITLCIVVNFLLSLIILIV